MSASDAPTACDESALVACLRCRKPIVSVRAPGAQSRDNAIMCPEGHLVCCECVGEIAKPSTHRRDVCAVPEDVGLQFTCPGCDKTCNLSPLHLLVVYTGSWTRTLANFDYHEEVDAWVRDRYDAHDNPLHSSDAGA